MNLNINSSGPLAGVQTITGTIATAGLYKLDCRSTFIAPSGATITLSQSGSVSVSITSGAPKANATHAELSGLFVCAIGDILTLAISSSNFNDSNAVNRLESVYTLSQI